MIELAEASMHINAPQREVFDLFTTEDGLCSWMAKEATIDLRPGGTWRWVHDDDVAVAGAYVEVDPHQKVSFTYGWESGSFSDLTPGSTTVEVIFDETATGTNVQIRHHAIPESFRDAHLAGWSYFLGVLAESAVGGPTPDIRLPRSD